jgi:hypothetical protein
MKNTQAYFVHTSQIGPIPFRNLPLQSTFAQLVIYFILILPKDSAGVPIAISGIEPPQQQQISRPTSSLQDRRPSSNKY